MSSGECEFLKDYLTITVANTTCRSVYKLGQCAPKCEVTYTELIITVLCGSTADLYIAQQLSCASSIQDVLEACCQLQEVASIDDVGGQRIDVANGLRSERPHGILHASVHFFIFLRTIYVF